MSYYRALKWGIAITFVMSLLSGCGGATPSSIELPPAPASTPLPAVPQVAAAQPTAIPTTGNTGPFPAAPTPTTEGTAAVQPSPTLPPPVDRPFLMRIERITVVTGRGTLLEGRVANGTLNEGGTVEILGPQDAVLSPDLLAILVSNAVRDEVTVGDYAGILVGGVEATTLSPGLLLAETGKYDSYEAALAQIQ